MRLSLIAALLAALAAAPPVRAQCSLSLHLPAPWIDATAVPWEGCGAEGLGVQEALDRIAAAGGGELRLRGSGALVVDQPLRLGSRTALHGSAQGGSRGTVVAGRPNERLDYRRRPLMIVAGVRDVGIHRFDFRAVGAAADHNLHGPAVIVFEAARVTLADLRSASVQMGIAVKYSSHVTIRRLELEMLRGRHGRPEGGAGVWLYGTSHSVLEHSVISGREYHAAGPPSNTDHRPPWPNPAPAMDLVATHGGRNNIIRHNRITHGNTAGIYAACLGGAFLCAPGAYEEGLLLWDNHLAEFRQHGIDIAHALAPRIAGNHVSSAGFAVLALGNVHDAQIEENVLENGGQDTGGVIYGALHFLWGSSRNRVAANHIDGAANDYTVYFKPGGGRPYASPAGNTVRSNTLRAGSTRGIAGGALDGNRVFMNERE